MSAIVLATPVALFDPAREGPPVGAIDIQLRMPRSMQVWVDDLHRTGRRHELADIQQVFEQLVYGLVTQVQHSCGHVLDEVHRLDPADTADAQLAITPVVEGEVPGVDGLRPHAHMYVGATGWRLGDGGPYPVAFASFKIGALEVVQQEFKRRLRAEAEGFGLCFGYSSPSGLQEVVDPPYAERGEEAGWVVCPGLWGPRRLILADQVTIEAGQANEHRRRLEEASGAGWTPVPVDEQVHRAGADAGG